MSLEAQNTLNLAVMFIVEIMCNPPISACLVHVIGCKRNKSSLNSGWIFIVSSVYDQHSAVQLIIYLCYGVSQRHTLFGRCGLCTGSIHTLLPAIKNKSPCFSTFHNLTSDKSHHILILISCEIRPLLTRLCSEYTNREVIQ